MKKSFDKLLQKMSPERRVRVDKKVTLLKKVDDVFGCLKRKQQSPVTVDAMNEGIRQRTK